MGNKGFLFFLRRTRYWGCQSADKKHEVKSIGEHWRGLFFGSGMAGEGKEGSQGIQEALREFEGSDRASSQ